MCIHVHTCTHARTRSMYATSQLGFIPSHRALNLATVAAMRGEVGVCDAGSLSPTQHAQCLLNRDTVYSSTQGVGVAIAQCQRQFSNRRWNCSASGPFENSFQVATSLGKLWVETRL